MSNFVEFPKIARFSRECVITEKIDGTNALIEIVDRSDLSAVLPNVSSIVATVGDILIYAGSRTKYITPQDDNYGFARWVQDNAKELSAMGAGRHFGEWWGLGIQRKYNVPEKRFSLFNTGRWVQLGTISTLLEKQQFAPSCCHVVPIITHGILDNIDITDVMLGLIANGSLCSPRFMNPEGIVIYHTAGNVYFKKTIMKDEEWKGKK